MVPYWDTDIGLIKALEDGLVKRSKRSETLLRVLSEVVYRLERAEGEITALQKTSRGTKASADKEK